MPRTLYQTEACPECEKVRLALSLENLLFETQDVDPANPAEVERVSGQTELPVLVESDGSVHVESNPILRHLAALESSRLLPVSRRDRELTWVMVDRSDTILGPLCRGIRSGMSPDGRPLDDGDRQVLTRRLARELAMMEGILERGPFLFGEWATVADLTARAYLNHLPRDVLESSLGDAARVGVWYKRILTGRHASWGT